MMNAGQKQAQQKQRKDIWLSQVEKGPSDYYLYAPDRQDSHGMGSTGKPMAFTGLTGIILFRPGSTVSASASASLCCVFPSGAPAARDAEVKLFAPSSPRQPAPCNSQLSTNFLRAASSVSLSPTSSSSSFCFHLFCLLSSLLPFFVSREAKAKLLHAHSRCHVTRLQSIHPALEAQTEQSRRPANITN